MATILRAYNDNGVKYDLDVFNEQQFLLDISAIESGDIGKVFGISSQTFALPPTENNNEYFGNLFDLGATMPSGSFLASGSSAPTTFTKTMPCQVLSDGVQIFDGKLYLESVITDEDGDTIYNVNVVNETIDFKYLIQDLTFGDLDWSEYNHDYTFTNISQSWDLNLFGGDIVYPLVEYGAEKDDNTASLLKSGGSLNTFTQALTPMLVNDFKPAVRITAILDKIFDTLDYKYTSSLFDSAYADTIYMLSTKDATRSGASYVSPTSQSFEARTIGLQTPTLFTPTQVLFDDEVYDNAGNYDVGTSRFTANVQGNYSFDVQLNTQLSGVSTAGTPRSVQIELYVNGVYAGIPPVWYNLKGLTNGAQKIMTANFTAPLNGGDYVEIYITFDTEDGGESISVRSTPQTSYWKCYQSPMSIIGGNVDLRGLFNADESVLDFLNGLIAKFNLVIEPIAENKKILSIEPFNTWIDNGNIVDWTDKVDRSVKWEIRHPMANQPRTLYFTDVEDKDEFNQYSIETFNKIFGDYRYVSESDLASGEKKIGSYFAPTPMKFIVGTTNFIVPQIYVADNGETKRIAFKPRLLHYLGLKDAILNGKIGTINTQNQWYFRDEGGTTHPMTKYPQFHHVSALNDDTALDLHFNNPQHWEYHQQYVSARTIHDAVYEYWSFYVNELYDVDGRLLTLNVDLIPTEIAKIRLNDKIFIDGHYYRINKISGANLTNEQSTKVELIKSLPRKLRYPRRRITQDLGIGVGIGYKDVYVGDISITGGVVYNDYNTGDTITGSDAEQAGTRDGFYVYDGIINAGSPQQSKPTTNIILGHNYVDDRVGGVIVQGNGNIIGGGMTDGIVVGENNDLSLVSGGVGIFGNNISTTGSLTNAFIVNTQDTPISIASGSSNVLALNPTQPITEYDNNRVVVGNILTQGNVYEIYENVNVSASSTTYLTGSHVEHFHHHFIWSGGNGTANVFIPSASLAEYDGLQMRFTTDGTLDASKVVNIIPSDGTLDGNPEEPLTTPYDGLTIAVINGNWQVIQRKK